MASDDRVSKFKESYTNIFKTAISELDSFINEGCDGMHKLMIFCAVMCSLDDEAFNVYINTKSAVIFDINEAKFEEFKDKIKAHRDIMKSLMADMNATAVFDGSDIYFEVGESIKPA
jgi:hypothetical protein